MTTKEEILALAGECGIQNDYISEDQAVEAFYHAARKDLEQEVERLKEEVRVTKEEDFPRKVKAVANNWKNKLASAQLQIKQYREVLAELEWSEHTFDNQGGGFQYCPGCGNRMSLGKHTVHCNIGKALALPADTSALEAIVEKAGEVMRERCAISVAWPLDSFAVRSEIRALPVVKLGDLK